MKKILLRSACAMALVFGAVAFEVTTIEPAAAQGDYGIGFDQFHDRLARHGDWVYSDRWGLVWIPFDVPSDFRPYDTDGYWAYTYDYGLTWVSDYDWGDIVFHYGRWVDDPDDGWLWIPGYEWAPAWVIWRSNGAYTGWMPMPPDDAFLGYGGGGFGIGVGFSFGNWDTNTWFGYERWYGRGYGRDRFARNWVFVPTGHMADRDFRRYEAPRGRNFDFIRRGRNITNYTVVNNYVVNRSVDPRILERASGRPLVQVHVEAIVHDPHLVVRADVGRDVQRHMRDENPHGRGLEGSAPPPPDKVTSALSTDLHVHNGQKPPHLFTRSTITEAPLSKGPANGTMGGQNGMGTGSGHTGNAGAMGNGAPGNGNSSNGMPNNGTPGNGRPGHHRFDNMNGPSGGNGTMQGGSMQGGSMQGGAMSGASGNGSGGETPNPRHHRDEMGGSPMNGGAGGAQGNGTPNNGTPNNGTPNNGTPNNGTPNNGTPNNGTLDNGRPGHRRFDNMNGPSGGNGAMQGGSMQGGSMQGGATNGAGGNGSGGETPYQRHHRDDMGGAPVNGGAVQGGTMQGSPPPPPPPRERMMTNPATTGGASGGGQGAQGGGNPPPPDKGDHPKGERHKPDKPDNNPQ